MAEKVKNPESLSANFASVAIRSNMKTPPNHIAIFLPVLTIIGMSTLFVRQASVIIFATEDLRLFIITYYKMIISLKTLILFGAILLTGLSAGLFYAWQVSVIPGTRKVTDLVYMESMQHINREILNPAFMLIFIGSLLMLAVSSYSLYPTGLAFGLMLAATLTYLLGTFAVTGMGNVPLNNELDALQLSSMTAEQLKSFREYYETKWNWLHLIRTTFAVLSFLLSLSILFVQDKIA